MLNLNVWFKCWIQVLDLNVEFKCLIQMLDLNVKLKCWNHVCFDRIYWSFWSCLPTFHPKTSLSKVTQRLPWSKCVFYLNNVIARTTILLQLLMLNQSQRNGHHSLTSTLHEVAKMTKIDWSKSWMEFVLFLWTIAKFVNLVADEAFASCKWQQQC